MNSSWILESQNETIHDLRYENGELNIENKRLTDLLIYALLPKRIYDHELSIDTIDKFREIVSNNLNDDTCTIKNKLVECWNNIGKEQNQTAQEESCQERRQKELLNLMSLKKA